MRYAGMVLLVVGLFTLTRCGEPDTKGERVTQQGSPLFDSAEYATVARRLRDAFVLGDSVYCDSVLPLFDDTALARMHPERVTDGFVSHLIIHERAQPAILARLDELVVYSGAPIMRNWRDYVKARSLQDAGERLQAIAAFELLIPRFQADKDTVGIATVSKRIGILYLDLDEPVIAAEYLLLARELEPRVDIRATITAMLGRCHATVGQLKQLRWCVARLNEDALDALHRERGDKRASINALWLDHVADLLDPGPEELRQALMEAPAVDGVIQEQGDATGYLVANEPAARVETVVLRARAMMRLGRSGEALSMLRSVPDVLDQCHDCLPQRLRYLSVAAEASAEQGDLRTALVHQKERAEVMALNEVGRARLALERSRAKAELERREEEADRLLQHARDQVRGSDKEHRMQRVNLVTMIGFIILFASVVFIRGRTARRIQLEQLRTRLSRDLHDDIGSTLSSINILSTVARRKAEAGDEAGAAASLSGISERTERLMRSMSDIVWSVDPDKDTMEELLVRLREFGAAVLEPKGISYTFDSSGDLSKAMTPALRSNLYLIFKEAVNNCAKHSEATKVTVSFTHAFDQLSVGGNGLRNMRARAAEMKAVLRISAVPGEGTTVDLVVPM